MKNTVVNYTLGLQKLLLTTSCLSFVLLISFLTYLDPYQNNLYIYLFSIILFLFFGSCFSLVSFLYFFTIKKIILSIKDVNKIIYQSLISSSLILFLLVLKQTDQVNLLNFTLIFIVYIAYQIWIRNE